MVLKNNSSAQNIPSVTLVLRLSWTCRPASLPLLRHSSSWSSVTIMTLLLSRNEAPRVGWRSLRLAIPSTFMLTPPSL